MLKDKLANIPRRALMCVIASGVFVLAACSGGGSPPQGSASETGAGPVTPVAPPAGEDVVWLAKLMTSEAGSISDVGQAVRATDAERSAVAWTALNRVKAGTFGKSVHDVVTAPGQFAYDKEPTSEILNLAGRLLKGQVPDPTSGATHFFSPIGMPKEGESTAGFDVGGGLHVVPGLAKKVYFPSWTTKLAWVEELQDVRQKYYIFYRPSGASPGGPRVAGSPEARIVFQSRDRSQIFIANADGTGIRLIANGDNPIWSPDGEKLAYSTTETREYDGDIRTLWLLTYRGPPVQLHRTDRAYPRYVDWAPDSAHLLFLTDHDFRPGSGFDYDLYLAKWDGTNKVRVGKLKWWTHLNNLPKWSPDGSRIAYINEFENLVVLNSDGTQPQRLAANVKAVPEWSPDGKRIAFGKGFVTLASGAITEFLGLEAWASPARFSPGLFSPDGGKLLVYDQQGHVYVVNSDGTGKIDLGKGESPQWSPDGKRITYSQTETFGQEVVGQYIFVVNPDGTGKVKIADGLNPRWIPATSWK